VVPEQDRHVPEPPRPGELVPVGGATERRGERPLVGHSPGEPRLPEELHRPLRDGLFRRPHPHRLRAEQSLVLGLGPGELAEDVFFPPPFRQEGEDRVVERARDELGSEFSRLPVGLHHPGEHLVLGLDQPDDVLLGEPGLPPQVRKPELVVELRGDLPQEEQPRRIEELLVGEGSLPRELVELGIAGVVILPAGVEHVPVDPEELVLHRRPLLRGDRPRVGDELPGPVEVVIHRPDVLVEAPLLPLLLGDLHVVRKLPEEAWLEVVGDLDPGVLAEDPRGVEVLLDPVDPHPGELVLVGDAVPVQGLVLMPHDRHVEGFFGQANQGYSKE